MRHFDLVQRLEQLPPPQETANPVQEALLTLRASDMGAVNPMNHDIEPIYRSGLGFAYMGMSEFEFGAVPDSARRIVANTRGLEVVSATLVRPTYEEAVHFVCTDEQAETTLPAWHEWSRNPDSIARPHYFRDAEGDSVDEGDSTVAWWALEEDLLWARDLVLAEKLKEAFTQRKRELFAEQSLPKRAWATVTGKAP